MNKFFQNDQFDFDYWADLAKDDPQAFEQKRKELIDNFINSAPVKHQNRLLSLQSLVDWERGQADTALESSMRLSQLMLNKLNGELLPALTKVKQEADTLRSNVHNQRVLTSIMNTQDNIIPFPHRKPEKITEH